MILQLLKTGCPFFPIKHKKKSRGKHSSLALRRRRILYSGYSDLCLTTRCKCVTSSPELSPLTDEPTTVSGFSEFPSAAALCQHEKESGGLLIRHVRRKAASQCDWVVHIGNCAAAGLFPHYLTKLSESSSLEGGGQAPFSSV